MFFSGVGVSDTSSDTSLTALSALPHSHLAVHDIGKVKGRQQVSHMKERLSVCFHDAMVTWHIGQQRVSSQPLETLPLVFRELLQNVALICRFEVPWREDEGRRVRAQAFKNSKSVISKEK